MRNENIFTGRIDCIMVLRDSIIITTRFSDTDAMQVIWHGNYLKYFEDGRESFGARFGLKYLDIYLQGFTAPIVHLDIDFKKSVSFNHPVRVEVTFEDSPAAKIIFDYEIYNCETEELIVTGKTIQVFLNLGGELNLTIPDFFKDWKISHGIGI